MSGSVEGAKETAKEPKAVPRASARVSAKAAAEPKIIESKPSADAMLKDAVSGGESKPGAAARKAQLGRREARYAAVAAGALVVGTAFGMLAAPKPSAVESLAGIQGALDTSRTEAARLGGEVEALGRTLAALRETTDAARAESRSLGASLYERLSAMEQGVDKRFASLSEAVEKSERDQSAKLIAQIEKRAAAPIPAPAPIAAVTPAKVEPATTGSIADAKPKTETIEGWAVRDVYAGIAMLEDRKRRLVEVGPGDHIPGIGRVEAVERRGRSWVVVTKQGIVTPQAW